MLTTSGVSGTSVKNQGLDLLIILTNNVQQNKGVLGVTCGGDSFFGNPIPNDYPRSMAIVLHESSHIFRNTGTHCSDSPYYLQGYELCAEELNSQYKPVLGGWNIFLSYIDKVCNTAYCTYYPDPIWTITNLHNRFGIPYA